jgi:hypothetical protein
VVQDQTHPDDAYHRLIGRCEQVAADGYLLRQVLDPAQLAPGSFFVDRTNQALCAWDISGRDLSTVFVEASTRLEILAVQGDYMQVRGLRFRFAANLRSTSVMAAGGLRRQRRRQEEQSQKEDTKTRKQFRVHGSRWSADEYPAPAGKAKPNPPHPAAHRWQVSRCTTG